MMTDPVDYQTAQVTAQSWVEDCAKEIKRQSGTDAIVHQSAVIEVKPGEPEPVATLEIGHGALIEMAVRDHGGRAYVPVLIVTEREVRAHRVGIGHQHVYEPMQTGKPNFKKAVRNAVLRAAEIQMIRQEGDGAPTPDKPDNKPATITAPVAAAPTKKAAAPVPPPDLRKLMAEELRGVKVPAEFLAARRSDASYTLHIGTIKLSLEQLRDFCKVANSY